MCRGEHVWAQLIMYHTRNLTLDTDGVTDNAIVVQGNGVDIICSNCIQSGGLYLPF